MRFGVCAPVSDAERLAKIGFDYIEVNASALALMPEGDFAAFCAANAAAPIHAEAANCLFPGSIRLTGDAVDWNEVEAYAEQVMRRLGEAGIRIAVFGSGGSRRVPEGYDRDSAWQQLIKTGSILGAAAEKHGVTVALEPLRSAETNIITTQAEGFKLVETVGHSHFKLLCDYYHLTEESGTPADVEACGDALAHTHIANPDGRCVMAPGDKADYHGFFHALRKAGYDSRMSIECPIADYEAQLPAALEIMKQA